MNPMITKVTTIRRNITVELTIFYLDQTAQAFYLQSDYGTSSPPGGARHEKTSLPHRVGVRGR